jgi:hypothetical protein
MGAEDALWSPRAFLYSVPVVRIKVFELLFLGVEEGWGVFRGLGGGEGNSNKQEKKNASESH